MRNFANAASPPVVGPGSYEAKKYTGEEGPKKTISSKFQEVNL
jgi:hypothetical protein